MGKELQQRHCIRLRDVCSLIRGSRLQLLCTAYTGYACEMFSKFNNDGRSSAGRLNIVK